MNNHPCKTPICSYTTYIRFLSSGAFPIPSWDIAQCTAGFAGFPPGTHSMPGAPVPFKGPSRQGPGCLLKGQGLDTLY